MAKPTTPSKYDEDDDDDDDDDDDEEDETPPPVKSSLKLSSSTVITPTKQKPTPPTPKQETTSANKTLTKNQLYINPIKDGITSDNLKSLYPKAKIVKMQKRKVGPERKLTQ